MLQCRLCHPVPFCGSATRQGKQRDPYQESSAHQQACVSSLGTPPETEWPHSDTSLCGSSKPPCRKACHNDQAHWVLLGEEGISAIALPCKEVARREQVKPGRSSDERLPSWFSFSLAGMEGP